MNREQKAKLEANRKLALERLKKRGILNKTQIQSIEKRNTTVKKVSDAPSTTYINNNAVLPNAVPNGPPSGDLQRSSISTTVMVHPEALQQLRDGTDKAPIAKIKPSIRRMDYIEYDFSTMKNLNGGYINPEDNRNYNDDDIGYGDDEHSNKKMKTIEQWKQEQRDRKLLYETAPPPEHISQADKCIECHINIEMDPVLDDVFKLHVCKTCAREHPDKYSLLTKTECKQDYFLTEPELDDDILFHKLEKPNPHSGTFARMQLFVRCEIEQYAYKKWEGEEGLDKEWKRREEGKLKRREKKYNEKIKEMRLKTRAQEFTRKLRDKKYGKIHVHNFSDPIPSGKDEDGNDLLKRRCIDCGLETEEVSI